MRFNVFLFLVVFCNLYFSQVSSARDPKDYDFEGVVDLGGCSGSVVRYEHSQATDRAMVLTNGHCIESGFQDPGTIVFNRPSDKRFRLLERNSQNSGSVYAEKILYATMTKTDFGLYRLRETFQEIEQKFNIRPMTLSSRRPNVGDEVEIVSGHWRRGFACRIEAFAYRLQEGDWITEDSIRYSRPGCAVFGGTSGSPLTLARSKIVVGVNNTGNEHGGRCTESNPCEIDQNGNVSFERGWNYAQQTYWVYSCLVGNEIDLSKQGCLLYRP